MMLRAARGDALAGLSTVVAELYDGSVRGTLDRLKMCAAQECRRVFFDRSKPATRRWCMSTLCGKPDENPNLPRASSRRRLVLSRAARSDAVYRPLCGTGRNCPYRKLHRHACSPSRIEIAEFHFWNCLKAGATNRGSTGFRQHRSIKLLPTNRINARAADFAHSLRTTAAICGTD